MGKYEDAGRKALESCALNSAGSHCTLNEFAVMVFGNAMIIEEVNIREEREENYHCLCGQGTFKRRNQKLRKRQSGIPAEF